MTGGITATGVATGKKDRQLLPAPPLAQLKMTILLTHLMSQHATKAKINF